MQLVKNRIIEHTPIRIYTRDKVWNPKVHALLYLLELENGYKLGSSGGQKNAANLGDYGCIVNTHANYGKRSESTDHHVSWMFVDITKIRNAASLKNASYDKLVHQMIFDYEPRIRYSKHNSDALVILELDNNGDQIERSLGANEYLQYLDILFNSGVAKIAYPPHTRQIEILNERKQFLNNHKDAHALVNVEGLHTRYGKDKTNYVGINENTQVVFDFSGYFATWQITSEFNEKIDIPVYTRGKSKTQILKELVSILKQNKRPWIMISTYNDEDSERIELLSIFKNANIEIVIDEVDYQVWQQSDLIKRIFENVIS